MRKTVTSHQVYTAATWNGLKKGEAIFNSPYRINLIVLFLKT